MQNKIILLGLVQGLTEFLPVSSSGHLALMQIFGGVETASVSYDIVLHFATMLATIVFFAYDIYYTAVEWIGGFFRESSRTKYGWAAGWAVIIATIITAVIGIFMKHIVENCMQNSLCIGLGLLFTGVLLIYSHFLKSGFGHVRPADGFIVGLAQGIATLPGVSRSGMTIFAGCLAGLSKDEAFRFSFLISIPAICGATLLEALQLGGFANFAAALPKGWLAGSITAFVSGFVALCILKKLVISAKWWLFGVYCLLLGAVTVVISFVGV